MLTVGEEERHKWRPKHQMQHLQHQQRQRMKGYESNVSRSKRSSHFQIKESILGRHRSANNFISTNSSGQLHMSNSSLSSSSTPSISSCLSISPTDQDGIVELTDDLHPRIVNSFGMDESVRNMINNVVDVPSSENGVSGVKK